MKIVGSLLSAAVLFALTPCIVGNAQNASPATRALPGLDESYMDKSADPCVDFYQYACGNFSKVHPIPADHSSFDSFYILYDHNQDILHVILEKAASGGAGRTANEQKIGDYYASCMDAAAIDKAGLTALKPELDRIAALNSKAGLTELLAHDQLISVSAFLGFGEQQDFKDARKQIAFITQAGLGLPERDYYLRSGDDDVKLRKQYVDHVAKILALLGEPEAQSTADAEAILVLETALAKASLDVVARREPENIYHIMTVDGFEKLTPSIDLKALIKGVGAPDVPDLNVSELDFFKGLEATLQSTSLDTIKAYLKWQVVNALDPVFLPKALDLERFNFDGKVLNGQPEQLPPLAALRFKTDGALGEALGQVYAAQEFPPSSKAATLQMVHDIEAAMDADIDTLAWMSPETKAKAKAKLGAVANKIGYPDKWRDYSKLAVDRGDGMGNLIRATEFESRRQIAKIGKPVDRGEFGMSPPTVNAYYAPNMNDINFPAGILQPPFYDPKASDAFNYGHIGGVVGHELTHGFDDQGRKFDGAGNLSEWWTASDAKQFEEKTDCEVKEYGDFTISGGVHVNGKLTLGENTADNGGLRLAYIALLADAARKHLDLSQKQGGYTAAQQFFLGHAQNWCGEYRPEQEKLQVQTDPHSPDQFRVNGVVRNMTEFGQAFGCKAGQPMMPANACRVW